MSDTFPDYLIRKGDTLPAVEYTLEDVDEDHPTLTGATVKFIYRLMGETQTANVKTATVVDAAENEVTYQWIAGNTDAVGLYACEWEVTYSDGRKLSFPRDGFLILQIAEDLG